MYQRDILYQFFLHEHGLPCHGTFSIGLKVCFAKYVTAVTFNKNQ
jgi:hypothetical protein